MVGVWQRIALFVVLFLCVGMKSGAAPFSLVDDNGVATLIVDDNDVTVVHKAADMFIEDVLAISGKPLIRQSQLTLSANTAIVVGTLGQSDIIDQLAAQGVIDTSAIEGRWETYQIFMTSLPQVSDKPVVIVAGSDRRGTAYGLLSLSRQLGVSPWEWWADVTPRKRYPLSLDITPTKSMSPSVKYRGIFLNDEDWGLQIWAAKTYEPETGDIGPKTYARVFELLLRLRANTIWPAMHKTTTPFYQIPKNKEVADDYAIVIGTSHAEPMLSNINGEWDKSSMGQYRYDTNADAVKTFFKKRITETQNYESIYTVAMRGEHDSPMIMRDSSMADQVALLDKVITDQRELLTSVTGASASAIPQAFVPYKEVLTYYQNGLEVPEDITLMWTDDNYGYLRQLSNPIEQQRAGGAGIYYHTSYWGRPHDYLWLNSTNPVLMWQEITKAWDLNAKEQWILNVGDIKPHEYNTELFMDIAWQREAFSSPEAVIARMKAYFARDLSSQVAAELGDIFQAYFHLVYQRRPEFMAWSQVEPVSLPQPTTLTQTHYGDEVTAWIDAWESLINRVDLVKAEVSSERQDAFFQLAYYPIVAAGSMNLKWLYHYKNKFAAAQGRGDAQWYANKMRDNYHSVQQLTDYFNNGLADGKWQNIMSSAPRHLPVFDLPASSQPQRENTLDIGLVLEGFDMPLNTIITNSHASTLPVFNAFSRKARFIDIYLNGDESSHWALNPEQPWIVLSQQSGVLTPEKPHQRIWVSIDWDNVPSGKALKEPPLGHDHQLIPPSFKVPGKLTFVSESLTTDITLNVYNPQLPELETFDGFVEDLGYVVINAEHYQRTSADKGAHWQRLSGIGYTGSVLQALPYSEESKRAIPLDVSGPSVEYDFYTFNQGEAQVTLNIVPTHPMYAGRGVRVAMAIDDQPPELMDFQTHGRSEAWKQNVLKNSASASVLQTIRQPGKHTLKIYMIDAGVMIDNILIDLGGKKASYKLPSETYNQALKN